ncbi:MAG: DUF1566 domain-containing protein [Thalassolituus sp.]
MDKFIRIISHIAFCAISLSSTPLFAEQLTDVIQTTPDSRYLIHNNGTATDTRTGLMWKVCSEGETWSDAACSADTSALLLTWNDAHIHAGSVEFAGFNDWRLPNYKELASLLDFSRSDPAINQNIFFDTTAANYWTSSASWRYEDYAFHVNFATGAIYISGLDGAYRIRLVRGGY